MSLEFVSYRDAVLVVGGCECAMGSGVVSGRLVSYWTFSSVAGGAAERRGNTADNAGRFACSANFESIDDGGVGPRDDTERRIWGV